MRIGVQRIVVATEHRRIVVAQYHGRAGQRVPFDQIDDRHRIGSIADVVAEEGEAVGPEAPRVREAGGERFQIAMYVGEQSQFHAQCALHGSAFPK